ncbi:MAG TPA: hypothetical protein VEL09_01890 [Burkholderiales bacterium]|nr:hypothetical protein [Burkholderiales bacterium]
MKLFRRRFRGMRLDERELRAAAGDMLDQLRPRRALRDARDFALKFQHDDVFREYVLSRIWTVLPVLLVFVLVSTVCAIGIMFNAARWISPPVPVWYRGFALLLGAAVWLGGVVAQVYVFLIWLEERAARKSRSARGIQVAVPAGVLAYLKYSRALPPWILVALCVAVPMAILAYYSPLAALLVVCVAVLAPVLFKKLDS